MSILRDKPSKINSVSEENFGNFANTYDGFKAGGRKPPFPTASKNQNRDEKIRLKGIEEFANFYAYYLEAREENPFKGRRTPNHYLVVDIWKDGNPYIRRVFQSVRTARLVISEYARQGFSILYRGIFYIPQAVWEEYKKRYKEVKENPRLSFEIFDFSKLIKVGDAIIIDLDNVSEEDVKRIVKYLHKLGIYPEVWLSASGKGYHIYIHLIYRVINKKKVEEVESFNGRIKQTTYYGRYYEFPYANDYRIELIIEGLKVLLKRLGIPYDSISANRAVWLEGVYNPLKGGKSEKTFDGAIHRIDKAYEKLRPLWEHSLKLKALKRFLVKKYEKDRVEIAAEIEETLASNPVDYIQTNLKNGTITRFLNAGYDFEEVGRILASHYERDEKAFWRAWRKAEDFIRLTFKPLKPSKSKLREERKHKHYWEYIPKIKECLEKGITSINGISKATGIPKSSVLEIFRRFTKEQILNQTEEVIAYLKANQKGGNKLPTERNRELGRKRFKRYFEEFLNQVIERKRKPVKERKAYLLGVGNKGVKDPLWREIPLDFPTEEKVDRTQKERDSLLIDTRSDRGLSITPEGNGREVVGEKLGEENKKEKSFETKLGTRGGSHKQSLLKNQPRMVKFYGKLRREEEVERIKPLVVGRRINADTWSLYNEAVIKLSDKGVLVAETEETLELLGKVEKPLIGRKLLKLIKFLYAHKFRQVDLRKKPTTKEVLRQPSVEKLDLGGWGRYAMPVYEVLLELGLIDETTEVKFPKVKPYEELEETLAEEELESLLSCEKEVNEYWERMEEIDRLSYEGEEIEKETTEVDEKEEPFEDIGEIEPTAEVEIEEPFEGEKDEFYNLLFGDWEKEVKERDEDIKPPGGDDDELYRLWFEED